MGWEADHVADVPVKRCIFWDAIILFLISITGTMLLLAELASAGNFPEPFCILHQLYFTA